MKQFYFLILVLISFLGKSQNNLQFNRVINFGGSIAPRSEVILDTVPSGKVWKIEAVGVYSSTLTVYFNGATSFIYGGAYSNSSPSGYYRNADASPIWLPSGSVLGQSCGCGGNRWFSILEFNVVP